MELLHKIDWSYLLVRRKDIILLCVPDNVRACSFFRLIRLTKSDIKNYTQKGTSFIEKLVVKIKTHPDDFKSQLIKEDKEILMDEIHKNGFLRNMTL